MNVTQLHSLSKRLSNTRSVRCTYLNQIAVRLFFLFLPITRQEELMAYFIRHPWRVARTRIRVIGVNFDQGKQNLVRVRGEFESSELDLTE